MQFALNIIGQGVCADSPFAFFAPKQSIVRIVLHSDRTHNVTELRSFSVLFAFFFGSFSFFSKKGQRTRRDRRNTKGCPKVRDGEGEG